MQEIDLSNYPRKKTYDWFKTFKNPTYGLNVTMDITKLIKHVKGADCENWHLLYFY